MKTETGEIAANWKWFMCWLGGEEGERGSSSAHSSIPSPIRLWLSTNDNELGSRPAWQFDWRFCRVFVQWNVKCGLNWHLIGLETSRERGEGERVCVRGSASDFRNSSKLIQFFGFMLNDDIFYEQSLEPARLGLKPLSRVKVTGQVSLLQTDREREKESEKGKINKYNQSAGICCLNCYNSVIFAPPFRRLFTTVLALLWHFSALRLAYPQGSLLTPYYPTSPVVAGLILAGKKFQLYF